MFPFFVVTHPILIAAAIIPAVALLIYIYKADQVEPEPLGMLLGLLLAGIFSTALAKITEEAGSFLLPIFFDRGSRTYNVLMYFVVVGCSEEGFKYLLLRWKTWNSWEFNYQFDAVVYAVFVSLGFALWENIAYVLMYGIGTAMVRAITAVPGHACFGVSMGAWYGMAKRYQRMGEVGASKLFRWLSFLLPALLHGAYDYIAVGAGSGSAWSFVIFVVILFAAAFFLVRRLSRRDRSV